MPEPHEKELIEELWSMTRRLGTKNSAERAFEDLKKIGDRHGKSWIYNSFMLANHRALNGLVRLQIAVFKYSENEVLEALKDLRKARATFTDVAAGTVRGRELMSERELVSRLHVIAWQIAVAHTLLRKHGASVPGSSVDMDTQLLSLDERAEVIVALETGKLLRNRLD